MRRPGLDSEGFIAREGDPAFVTREFAPVVAAARERIAASFDGSRLHGGYLYGSVPRGTARPGVSDLDVLLALHAGPTAADRADADRVAASLDRDFPQIDGVGVLLFGVDTLLSEVERHDLGWFVACLCTPLLGEDIGPLLPRYRPSRLLARETNGDLATYLPDWRRRAATGRAADLARLGRSAGRKLVRTGFTLVMPRWGGWTSDLELSAEVFGRYYPARAGQMRQAAVVARGRSAEPGVLSVLVDDLAPWLAAEYTAVHGEKAPR